MVITQILLERLFINFFIYNDNPDSKWRTKLDFFSLAKKKLEFFNFLVLVLLFPK